jgi:hypothetical protein
MTEFTKYNEVSEKPLLISTLRRDHMMNNLDEASLI